VSVGHVYCLFVDTYHDMCDNVKDHTILILFLYLCGSIVCSFRLCCLFSHSMGFLAVGEGAVKQSELHRPAHYAGWMVCRQETLFLVFLSHS
jgi:hypothetical protein